MPQMKNLSGSVSAEAKGSMEVFPGVLRQRAFAYGGSGGSGQELKVHQNRFIRRITKMMLIPGSDDIHIRNMNVRASVHDNLFELEPFDFRFSNYGLRMQGLNNFNGDLYYHIGVERNPLHIPFGIIIEGSIPIRSCGSGGRVMMNVVHSESRVASCRKRISTSLKRPVVI